jgi:hypothetical protein
MKKFRWTDWLAAAALVITLGAFAGAESPEQGVVTAQLR